MRAESEVGGFCTTPRIMRWSEDRGFADATEEKESRLRVLSIVERDFWF